MDIMGTDDSGRERTGGLGTSGDDPVNDRGGEHGEKKATNADHDQKIAENRKHILDHDDRRPVKGQDINTQSC